MTGFMAVPVDTLYGGNGNDSRLRKSPGWRRAMLRETAVSETDKGASGTARNRAASATGNCGI